MWEYGQQAIRESGEAGVTASWGIKKASLYIALYILTLCSRGVNH